RKKTPLVIKSLPLEPEPHARAQLQVMRRNIATRYRKKSAGDKNRRRLAIENRSADKNNRLLAIDNRIADIEPHGYSPCRIELDNSADIQRKLSVGVAEFDRIANRSENRPGKATERPETGFGVNKTGPHFAKNAEPV